MDSSKRSLPRIAAVLGFLAATAACTVLLDNAAEQCARDADCAPFGGYPYCRNGACVPSNLGPEGCAFGRPVTQSDWLNQCTTSQCVRFDNCARIGICGPGAVPAAPVAPPPRSPTASSDAGAAPTLPLCAGLSSNRVVVAGSTAVQPFLGIVATLLSQEANPLGIVYQPSGSCVGVDSLFSLDPAKRILKDIPGRPALYFNADGSTTACSLGDGVDVGIVVSDVFASSCNASYAPSDQVAEYFGPIQPMVFVTPSSSPETAISAELASVVFGLGSTNGGVAPYVDPSLYFVRNAGSGTQQMIARAIDVDAKAWWGVDRGSSTGVRDLLEAVPQTLSAGAIGILSTDFADAERARLRILAFQAKGQSCSYLPDSTPFSQDKANVRDGHYTVWGPVHFFARVSNGVPSASSAAFVTRFSVPRLEEPLLLKISKSGLVPACAMKVKRETEMGPVAAYAPDFQCGCYFQATVPGGTPPATCVPCTGSASCPATAPACNLGFCEVK